MYKNKQRELEKAEGPPRRHPDIPEIRIRGIKGARHRCDVAEIGGIFKIKCVFLFLKLNHRCCHSMIPLLEKIRRWPPRRHAGIPEIRIRGIKGARLRYMCGSHSDVAGIGVILRNKYVVLLPVIIFLEFKIRKEN